MPNRRYNGGGDRCDSPDQPLIREGEKVLHASSTTGEDDDIDLGIGIQSGQGAEHRLNCPVTLDLDLTRGKGDGGPALGRIDLDVFFRFGITAADKANLAREEGKGKLTARIEEAFGGQLLLEKFDAREKIAKTYGPDFVCPEREGAVALVEIWLSADDDAAARLHRIRQQERHNLDGDGIVDFHIT